MLSFMHVGHCKVPASFSQSALRHLRLVGGSSAIFGWMLCCAVRAAMLAMERLRPKKSWGRDGRLDKRKACSGRLVPPVRATLPKPQDTETLAAAPRLHDYSSCRWPAITEPDGRDVLATVMPQRLESNGQKIAI